MAEEKSTVVLTAEAKEAVRGYMLKIFGIAGPAVAIIAGIAGYLIKDLAASNAVNVALQEIQQPLINANQQVSEALTSAAALEDKADGLETQIATLNQQIADFEAAAEPEKIVARVSAEIVASHRPNLLQPLETSLSEKLDATARSLSLPNGAVIAVLSDASQPCPGDEWKPFDDAIGRVIVGAGHDDENGLSTRSVGATGGAETHELTVEEMPEHRHQMKVFPQSEKGSGRDEPWAWERTYDTPKYIETGPAGGRLSDGLTKPHNNMPPYIALYFCQKVGG